MKFLSLFDITIETALLIVLIGILNRLLKNKLDPNTRYFLWIFVAVRLLVPIRIGLSVEVPVLFNTAVEHSQDVQTVQPDATKAAPDIFPPAVAEHTANAPQKDTAVSPADISAPLQQSPTDTEAAPEKLAVTVKKAAQLIWGLGAVVLSAYVLINNVSVFLTFRKSRQKIRVLNNGIPLYAMPGYNCLAGVASPAIYIDTDSLADPGVIQNVISHELSHYRVRDNYWQLLRVVCLILQWHNPFMWWAYFASRRDCEMACDARVVRNMTSQERYGYGNSLLAVTEAVCQKKHQTVLCSTSMGGNKSFMKERIYEIMQYKRKHATILLIIIICVIGAGCFVSFHLYASAEKDHNPALEISSGSPEDYEDIFASEDLELTPGNAVEPSPQEEAGPVAVNLADYYITRTGNPSNLYTIDENNVLWGCGWNNCGQLGQGTQDYDFHEDMVKIAEHVIHVDYSQNDFMIYLTEDHKLYGVGNAGCGALQQYETFDPMQYTNSEHYTVTTPCLLMENVVYARCGRGDVACMTENAEIWVFGTIGFDRTEICYSQYPVKVLENAAFVTGGFFHHAALLQDGSVWTWGYNYAGGCGVPEVGIVSVPTKVAEHVRMVWTGNPEYNVRYDNIADFDGVYERQMENTIILTDDGEYLICGAHVGTERKTLPLYYEATDYSLICTHEFRSYTLPVQEFTLEETAVVPEIKEYDFQSAKEAGTIQQIHGMLPGAGEGTWYTITIDGVEYYYGHSDFQEEENAQLFAYAIFSDKYSLINGLSVGMTVEEVLEKYPNMAITNFYGEQLGNLRMAGMVDAIGWNPIAYPHSYFGMDEAEKSDDGRDYDWSDQFDYIMFANIDQGADTLPVCVGLLVSGNVVAAITFFYPTAG